MDIKISEKRMENLKKYAATDYNCCQKVCLAFEDEFSLSHEDLVRMAAPFGGGMGHFGLTCGALAAAGIVFANHFGDGFKENPEYKTQFYEALKELCETFQARTGAATCASFEKMQAAGIGYTCPELEKIAVSVVEEFVEKYKGQFQDRLAAK